MHRKLKGRRAAAALAANLRRQGKKVVTFNGSFDVLHAGHVRSLREARSRGDVLMVLLNSDRSVAGYKGPGRPIVPERERAEMLAALACVDYVTIFDEINPLEVLDEIKPDIHCNGSDWGKNCVERAVVEKNGGRVQVLRWQPGHSTTMLLQKMLAAASAPAARAVFLGRCEGIEDLSGLGDAGYEIVMIEDGPEGGSAFQGREGADAPQGGVLEKAGRALGLSLSESWVVGGDPKDVIMGRRANVKTIKIGGRMPRRLKLEPGFYADDVAAAVAIILSGRQVAG